MAATTHRKLFPLSATAANQSLDCPDFCDPACPYNCPYPDFYFLPPPPPPPDNHSVHTLHFSLAAIVSVSVLAGVFLVLSYYVIIKRFRNGDPGTTRSNAPEEFLEDGYRVDHPVWFIATAGLRPAVINSITACRYKKNDGLVEGTECSVCLAEFREDETLRIMPKCNHAFHIPCIDTWLRSHTNCPLCRASIVNEPVVAARPAEPETQIGNSVDGDRDGTENQTEVPKDENGDSVVINIDVEDEEACEDEVRQPPRMSVSLALGRNEECSSGSDKGTLNGVEKSDMV